MLGSYSFENIKMLCTVLSMKSIMHLQAELAERLAAVLPLMSAEVSITNHILQKWPSALTQAFTGSVAYLQHLDMHVVINTAGSAAVLQGLCQDNAAGVVWH